MSARRAEGSKLTYAPPTLAVVKRYLRGQGALDLYSRYGQMMGVELITRGSTTSSGKGGVDARRRGPPASSPAVDRRAVEHPDGEDRAWELIDSRPRG